MRVNGASARARRAVGVLVVLLCGQQCFGRTLQATTAWPGDQLGVGRQLKQGLPAAELYQRCGGEAPNDLPAGASPVDNCFTTCASGTCYRQNRFYWQCLQEDPCSQPGWDCSKACTGSGITTIPTPPPPPPPPADTAKCGNDIPFLAIDLCDSGLRCTHKDKTYMQCLPKVEEGLGLLAEGDSCGDKNPYDNASSPVKVCPKGTACVNAQQDGSGAWTCSKDGGFYQDAIVGDNQCASLTFFSSKPCPVGSFCLQYDKFYHGCVTSPLFKQLNEGDQCGIEHPYSGEYQNSFCPLDKPCVPAKTFWTVVDGTIDLFVCSGANPKLSVGVQCGDALGPWNGYYTCSTAQPDENGFYNLCWQDGDTEMWKCREIKEGLQYKPDNEVCGTGGPYGNKDGTDRTPVVCLGATSSCWLYDAGTEEYRCWKDRCPTEAGWDCTANTLPALDDFYAPCGPIWNSYASSLAELYPGLPTKCNVDSECMLKDPYGTFQCVPKSISGGKRKLAAVPRKVGGPKP